MITETQIEDYFRSKVEEFRARGVPVEMLTAEFYQPSSRPRLVWDIIAANGYCVVTHESSESAFNAIQAKIGNSATKAAELRAQAEQLLKSADELEGKV